MSKTNLAVNGYSVDFVNSFITLTADFAKKAQNPNNVQYRTLKRLQTDFPNMIVIRRKASKHKRSLKQLPYDKMVKYLSCQPNATQLLLDFNEMRDFSKSQPSPYAYMNDWFFSRFPEYGKLPTFDDKGKREPQPAQPEQKVA